MGAKPFWPLKHLKKLKVQIRDCLHGFNRNPIIRSHTEKNRPVNHLWHGTISTNIQCYHSVIHILGGSERMQEAYEFGKGYMKLVCTLDTYGVSHVAPKGKNCCLVPHLSIPQCTFRFLLHQRLKAEDSCLCVCCLGHWHS